MRRSLFNWACVVGFFPLTAYAADFSPGHAVNSVGRWIGYGWSRGYHSHDNRPTPRYFSQGTILEAVPEPEMEMLPPAQSSHVLPAPTPAKQSSRRTFAPHSNQLLKPAEISPAHPAVSTEGQFPAAANRQAPARSRF